MSRFLGFESFLIPLGSTVSDVHTTIRSALTTKGWRVVHDSLLFYVINTLGTLNGATYKREFAFGLNYSDSACASIGGLTTNPVWLGMEANVATEVKQVCIHIGSNKDDSPKDYTIDWSDDGNSWTTALTETGVVWYSGWDRRYVNIPASGAHKFWRLNVTARQSNSSTCTIEQLEFMDQYGNVAKTIAGGTYFDCIPPVTEQIGDSNARGLVRFSFSSTNISVMPIYQTLRELPPINFIRESKGGTNQASIVLNGVTVVQDPATLAAGNTAKQNLRYLYEALRNSTDPEILNWSFEYLPCATQNQNDLSDYIICRCKISRNNVDITSNGNVLVGFASDYIPANFSIPFALEYKANISTPGQVAIPVNIDLANGFIYYLQVNARGLALAIKTVSSYFGPVHACYADHDKSMKAKPATVDASIVELFVGYDDDSSNLDSWARASHWWMCKGYWYSKDNQSMSSDYYSTFCHPLSKFAPRYLIFDGVSPYYGNDYNPPVRLLGSNIWWDDVSTGNDFQVHRVSIPGVSTLTADRSYSTIFTPPADIQDWFKFRGTMTQESLILVADTQTYTTLPATILAADNPTTLVLQSTDGFNTSGFVSIGDEIFQYTGISGNTLTGVSRAKYGSVARTQFVNDKVYQCLWFTIINGGALLCGFNKPS